MYSGEISLSPPHPGSQLLTVLLGGDFDAILTLLSCRIFMAYSVVYYLNVSFSELITSVQEEIAVFLLSITRNYVLFLFEGIPSSSGCFR